MGGVDSWLKEHAVLHTTTGAYDPHARSLVEESIASHKRRTRCLLHQANESVVEPIVLELQAFVDGTESDLLS